MDLRHHQLIRFLALSAAGVSVTYMAGRSGVRSDVTEEGLSRISAPTQQVIQEIDEERPVVVHAFVSKDVPREYVTVRSRLLNILRTMEAKGGPGLQVRIVEPEPHSVAAEEALENYGIGPQQLVERTGGRVRAMDVYLGLALVSGPRTQVIPFLDRGLSVEYEVNRALRVVRQEERKVVGILRTDATIMGNFDMQTRRRQPGWQIVEELRKQYDVRSLNPGSPIPDDVDVLIVPQLPSCTDAELAVIRSYVDAGRPALLTVDPAPLFDLRLTPSEPKPAPPGQSHGSEPKGDYQGFLQQIGVEWPQEKIVYDIANPNPILGPTPKQIVFSTDPQGGEVFSGVDPSVDGLTQVVTIFGGEISPAPGFEDAFTPLLTTSTRAGTFQFDELYERNMLFGLAPRRMQGPGSPITGERHVLAARIASKAEGPEGATAKPRDVVVFADLDAFGDVFFSMYSRGGDIDGDGLDDVRFDNVPFLLNLVDELAADDRFIELRRRRPAYRRLTKVDELTKLAREERQTLVEQANAKAEAELEAAKANLEKAVATIRERTDLDDTTKDVSLSSVEAAENRRLQAKTSEIEREKEREIQKIDNKHGREVDEIQNRLRLLAVLIPPLPALLLGGFIFGRKRRRERDAIPNRRRKGNAQAKKGNA